jgi:hypothetical protein
VTTADREDLFLSGRSLTLALAAIALLTFVLPPVLARQLHQRRISLASSQVKAVANALAGLGAETLARDPRLRDVEVLSGPGDAVSDARDRAWITARTASLEPYVKLPPGSLAPDPWARALQMNLGAARAGGRVWVLSAGPNGIVETPFSSTGSAAPDGDDIAVPLP